MKTITDEKVIFEDSPEAASLRTVTGWVDRHGRFWGDDERAARYNGYTHKRCEKNANHPLYMRNSYCRLCQEEKRREAFINMPRRDWQGEPLVIFDSETYFFDEDSLLDYCHETRCQPQDLQLVICEPNKAMGVDSDYWADELPEEHDLPQALLDALDELNEVIRGLPPLSWSQGSCVAVIPNDLRVEHGN